MPFPLLDPAAATIVPSTGLGDPVANNGMSLAELQSTLEMASGGRTDIEGPRFQMFINWAYVDLATDLKLEDLKGSLAFNLEVGQAIYHLPREVWTTIGASVENTGATYPSHGGTALKKVTLEDYRKLPALEDDVPTQFFRHGDLLIIYPTPSVSYPLVLDFYIRPLFLENAADCPILGVEWHEGILLAARAKMFRIVLEPELAAMSENEFISFVRKKKDRESAETEGRRPATDLPHRTSGKMMYKKPYYERNW